jgi:deoxyribose-phosphate aldolase
MSNDFGRHIDHTLLRPTGTTADIRQLCAEAMEHGMAAVCVFPSYVAQARELLKDSRVRVATVIAFPFGVTFTEIKEAELRAAARLGAGEADFVINIAALKSGAASTVEKEMQHLTEKARGLGVVTKFIIETAYLSHEEKLLTCSIANRVRPDFMKTSTGFGPSGATVQDVKLMRDNLLPEIQIKAAGGIRTYKDARALLEAGASRLGTSSGIAIVHERLRMSGTNVSPIGRNHQEMQARQGAAINEKEAGKS